MLISLTINALVVGFVYGIIGIGYSLIYAASGLLTFCEGELLMIGAFLGLTFYKFFALPFIVAVLLCMVIMFLIGMGIERFLIRPVLNKNADEIYVVLVTIALAIIMRNAAQHIWGTTSFAFPSIFHVNTITIMGARIRPEAFLLIFVGIITMYALHLFMTKMKFGTSMRAAAINPLAARSVGINVGLTTGITWGIASALGGLSGTLFGPVQGVSATMGTLIGMKGFAAAVIGGYGNMYGAIIGGIIIGFVEVFCSAYITSTYKDLVVFGIFIMVLILMPRGIMKGDVYDR